MYLKSDDTIPLNENEMTYKQLEIMGNIAASGNIMSLLNFSDTVTNYGFYGLFASCSLTTTPELPATTLGESCYESMFSMCMSLTQAPTILPATTLATSCYKDMFSYCMSLTTAPELPATTLTRSCYGSMFQNCTSLTQTPELPATTLADSCYSGMFYGCTSLTKAPALPATELVDFCYNVMFQNCTSLVTAPTLSATTLATNCCRRMFYGCAALTQAPALPATTLVDYCYSEMFYKCTSLVTTPELPATTLAENCYRSMFRECTSLTTAPELPATTLSAMCYFAMFRQCSKLNYVKALFTDIPANSLGSWLNSVSTTGTFIKSKDATWTNEQAGIPSGWTVQVEGGVTPEPEPERDYLCFTSTGDSTVSMTQNGTPNTSANKVIQYKLNDGQWQTWDLSAVTLHDADKMYLKSDDEIPMSESEEIYKQFVMTGSITATGNIMSLLNFSTTLTTYALVYLFYDCTSLTTAPELPATTLTESCYQNMFSGCTSLTTAPALHATTLNLSCYESMFFNCTSLTQATALPATTLVDRCYNAMFFGCTSLTTAPELPATTLAYTGYNSMFKGCSKLNYVKAMFTAVPNANYLGYWLDSVSKTGTFVKNSAATWANDEAGIPSGWTIQTASPDK
jgi:hypothetical protein